MHNNRENSEELHRYSMSFWSYDLSRMLNDAADKTFVQWSVRIPSLTFFERRIHQPFGGFTLNNRPLPTRRPAYPTHLMLITAWLLGSCAAYGPYHANTATQPFNSVRGPADGRYKMAFVEFGDQGSPLDNSQRKAALEVIHKAPRPLLFVYIHGWQNNAASGDVCRFEHFLDMVSSFPEFTGRKINVIGVYIAWRGKDLTAPGLNFLTFWSRKSTGGGIAAANSCLATIEELAAPLHIIVEQCLPAVCKCSACRSKS